VQFWQGGFSKKPYYSTDQSVSALIYNANLFGIFKYKSEFNYIMPLFRSYRLKRVGRKISASELRLRSLESQLKEYDRELKTTGLNDIASSLQTSVTAEAQIHERRLKRLRRKKDKLSGLFLP